MQTYVVNRLIQSYSLKKLDDHTRILHSALALYLSVTLIAMILVAALIPILLFQKWLRLEHTGHLVSVVVVLLLAGQIVFGIPFGLIRGLYSTVGEYPRGAMTSNVQQFSLYGLIVLVLIVDGGLVSVAAVQLVPLIGITLFIFHDLKHRHPEIRIGIRERDSHLAFTLFGPSLLFLLMSVANALTIQGTTLVVNMFFGSASVAVFATLRTMSNLIRQIVQSFHLPVWVEITSLEAKRDYRKLRTIHRLLVKLSLMTCASAAVVFHFTGKDIVGLWTQGRITFDQSFLDIFLFYMTTQAIWLTSSVFLKATNRHKNLCLCYIISGILGLGLALVLSSKIGLNGVITGLWIADISVCLWFIPWETCKLIKESVREFWIDCVLRGFPVILVQCLVTWRIASVVEAPLLRIVSACLGVSTIVITAGYFLWLNTIERARVSSLASEVWRCIRRL